MNQPSIMKWNVTQVLNTGHMMIMIPIKSIRVNKDHMYIYIYKYTHIILFWRQHIKKWYYCQVHIKHTIDRTPCITCRFILSLEVFVGAPWSFQVGWSRNHHLLHTYREKLRCIYLWVYLTSVRIWYLFASCMHTISTVDWLSKMRMNSLPI